ncbi:MAG TPA: hypothetical protein VGC41_29545 [Kofleriaceae bacterium]
MTDDKRLTRLAAATGFLVIATFVAGKAARDATVLSTFSIKLLPTFVGIGAAITIPLVLFIGRRLAQKGPAWLFPRMNASSATLLVLEWFFLPNKLAAAVAYVHLAALGPVFVSGFWSTINERLDARAAKRAIGNVGFATTLGGIAGGLVAQAVAAWLPPSAILLVVAMMQLVSALLLAALGRRAPLTAPEANPSIWTGTRVIAKSSLLRNVFALIVLGAMGAAALDYVFKADISRAGSPLKALALYYTVTSVVTAIVQLVATDKTIAKLGVAGSAVALPMTVAGFGAVLLAAPRAGFTAIARGAELVMRSSIYRAGYELLFTPLPATDKRPAKVVLDVGAERVGDILGSQLISLLLFGLPHSRTAIVTAAVVLGLLAIGVALHLPSAYTAQLEQSLLAVGPTPQHSLPIPPVPGGSGLHSLIPNNTRPLPVMRDSLASIVEDLRSGEQKRVEHALEEPLIPELVPLVLPLLGWAPVSDLAAMRLRDIAPRVTGTLVDALLDKETDFTVRRRLPAILENGDPDRAQYGLWRSLTDERFEVRYRAGKALAKLRDQGTKLAVTPDQVYDAVLREVGVDVRIWKGRNLLDGYQGPPTEMRLYHALAERSSTALDHVFTLLGLVLPSQPLRIALAALSTDDQALHGTALEYLESILPPRVRGPLWPFLELDATAKPDHLHAPHDIVAALDHAHPSILAYLDPEDSDDPGN